MKISKPDLESKLITVIFITIAVSCSAENVLPCDNSTESNIKITNLVAPTFPTRPYDNQISEGFVKLRIEVNSGGLVQNVMILESKPNRFFDIAAINAIQQSKFSSSSEPELRCGIITYDFKLE